jgi:hypothetical protein
MTMPKKTAIGVSVAVVVVYLAVIVAAAWVAIHFIRKWW